uniref:C2H2-type domain-containing protein n=1 Tax=Knipowitschia caucasica TaxID=637954 RepID=A0AAV2LAC7_KNICA
MAKVYWPILLLCGKLIVCSNLHLSLNATYQCLISDLNMDSPQSGSPPQADPLPLFAQGNKTSQERVAVKDAQLSKHERSHSAQKTFQCPDCHKAYKTPTELRNHSRSHTVQQQEQDPEQGSVCGITADTSLPQLSSHCDVNFGTWDQVQVTENLPTVDSSCLSVVKVDVHVCETCRAEFIQLSDLQEHEKQHPKPRPHVCDTCGKAFHNKSGLRKHQKIHSNSKPHSCSLCGKTFLFAAYLRKHLRTHAAAASDLTMSSSTIEASAISLTDPVSAFQNMPEYLVKQENV